MEYLGYFGCDGCDEMEGDELLWRCRVVVEDLLRLLATIVRCP